MLNAYWDFTSVGPRCLTPYVGIGIGFAFADADFSLNNSQIIEDNGSDSSFAYQYMVGVNYNMYQTVNLFVEYRRFMTNDLSIEGVTGFEGGTDSYDFDSGDIIGGIRFKF